MKNSLLFLALLVGLSAAHAQGHTGHSMSAAMTMSGMAHDMSGMTSMAGMHHPSLPAGSPQAAFHQQMDSVMTVMDKGMQAMGGVSPADIDASFAAMMVPHHQGAVDMARLQLLYGKDPELRRLAQSIIAEQQIEIQQMDAWLRKHQDKATSVAPAVPAHQH
ncbi:DUF305 domain-containing protein [Hymenobacter sp. GOD-10R]|uniref:DUF305 domain-containing protein n=1 Tax=Hymenobacter sp. GOD-10R TaxID=3093922 RepID=UPI002D77B973|nr:DUF305 domain-containing protein [Hymenobacter sp. GOD-10R]WRQ26576.1 DUF305 domain-containing protein [Hymenobacter sp. GOD-10R]